MNQEHLDFIRSAADAGVFVHLSMSIWNPSKNISINSFDGFPNPGIGETITCARRFRIPQTSKSRRLLSGCKLAIRNLSYKTSYGNFIPEPNIERFRLEINEFREKIMKARDEILDDYDAIIKTTAGEAAKIAVLTWTIKHGHSGNPHPRFIEKFVDDYVGNIGTRDDLSRRFKFTIIPTHPILDPNSSYSDLLDVSANNIMVCELLYEKILNRRRAIASVMLKMEVELKAARGDHHTIAKICRRMLTKLQGYIWSFFYSDIDPDIISLIESLRSIIIVDDEHRSNVDNLIPYMRKIVSHVTGHPFFRTGMEVVGG